MRTLKNVSHDIYLQNESDDPVFHDFSHFWPIFLDYSNRKYCHGSLILWQKCQKSPKSIAKCMWFQSKRTQKMPILPQKRSKTEFWDPMLILGQKTKTRVFFCNFVIFWKFLKSSPSKSRKKRYEQRFSAEHFPKKCSFDLFLPKFRHNYCGTRFIIVMSKIYGYCNTYEQLFSAEHS